MWQGAPNWWAIARQVFHVRVVVAYFVLYGVYQAMAVSNDGGALPEALFSGVTTAALALPAVGILLGIAWLVQRTTLYTITSKRILLGVGIALPKTFNIPFEHVDGVSFQPNPDGTGNISLKLSKRTRIAWLVLWPHLRPWHFSNPEPTLRGLPNAAAVASDLAAAIHASVPASTAVQAVAAPAAPEAPATSAVPKAKPQQAANSAAPLPVRLTFALMVCCAAFVAIHQWTKSDSAVASARVAQDSMPISFQRTGDFGWSVLNPETGETITELTSGNDGIIRGAMRSFTNRRTVSKLALDAPYQLVRWDNGEVALYDALTDTSVPIDAFGPYAPGATLDLINLMKKPAAD